MDLEEFREIGYEMVDYLVDYLNSVTEREILPTVPEGYLLKAFGSEPPTEGDNFRKIMEDFETYVMPGLVQCQHPGFHAYLPSSGSYSSVIGNMLADIFSIISLNWDYSPASSELEVILTNWFGEMIGLPECFLNRGENNRGTGVMQRSTNECLFLCMVTARRNALRKLTHLNPSISKSALLTSLVAYCSRHSHSAIGKIALATLVNVRVLDTDGDNKLRGRTLAKAMEADRRIGLIPFFVDITIGTFANGSSEDITEIGPICEQYGVWLNVEAAYGGCALVCPEYKYLLEGIDYASSFIVAPNYWLLVHVDTALLFLQDRYKLKKSAVVDRTLYGYSFGEKDWSYPCRTENQSMKYLFVLRLYGLEGLQRHVRNHLQLARLFEECVKADDRFEVLSRHFGIVCFRLKGDDRVNRLLNCFINASGKLFMTPTFLGGKYTLRFVLCTERVNENDVRLAWEVISEEAEKALEDKDREMELRSFERLEEMYKYNIT